MESDDGDGDGDGGYVVCSQETTPPGADRYPFCTPGAPHPTLMGELWSEHTTDGLDIFCKGTRTRLSRHSGFAPFFKEKLTFFLVNPRFTQDFSFFFRVNFSTFPKIAP